MIAMEEIRRGEVQHISAALAERNIVLKGADVLSAKGFTQVPNYVLESDRLSPGAKLTYAMLLKYAWQNDFCYPGQDRLARDMGSGVRSVVRYIQELEKGEFIKIRKRGLGKPNLYELDLQRKESGASRSAKMALPEMPNLDA